ncbi:MAG: AI-2E family transporter, partial [Chloroflexi bacterium]|nr:AI-2E family transporter [Chloroflexota bacterium]
MTTPEAASPRWGGTVKALVALTGLVLVAALLVRFQGIVPLLVLAGIISYLSLPYVRALHHRARLSWPASTNIIFVYWLALLILAFTAVGVAVVQQVQALLLALQGVLDGVPAQLEALSRQSFVLGPWSFTPTTTEIIPLVERALGAIEPAFGRASGLVASAAGHALESLASLVFVLAVSYFLTLDSDRIRSRWSGIAIPRYEYDLGRLRQALTHIWHAFLRGQLLIVLIMGILMAVL